MAVKPILLDTNAYAAFKRGMPDAVELIRHASLIGISVVVLGELFGGFALGSREQRNREELSAFLQSSRVQVFSITAGTSEHYGVVYQELKRRGKPIPTNDMWIAATAIQHGYGLFTYDRHFEAIDEIKVGTYLNAFLL